MKLKIKIEDPFGTDAYEVDDTLINVEDVNLGSRSMWNNRFPNRTVKEIRINDKDLVIRVDDIFGPYTYNFTNFMKYGVYKKDGVLKDADDSPRIITVINMGDKK